MPRRCMVRIRGGYKAVTEALEAYKREIYRYNSVISGTGFYLKPVHIVTRRLPDGTRRRYLYIGRYWWRLGYTSDRGRKRLRWRYIGTEKPPELKGYPRPPSSPLQGLRVVVEGEDVLVDCSLFRRYRWLFKGYTAEPAEG